MVLGVIAVAIVMGGVPSPAPAAEGGARAAMAGMAYTGSSTAVETNSANTTSARAAANYTGVVDGPGITFAFECDGQGLGATAATSLVRCYLQTSGADHDSPTRTNLPGNVIATARTLWLDFTDIGDTVTVCAEVEVLPVLGDPIAATTCTDAGVGLTGEPRSHKERVRVTAALEGSPLAGKADVTGPPTAYVCAVDVEPGMPEALEIDLGCLVEATPFENESWVYAQDPPHASIAGTIPDQRYRYPYRICAVTVVRFVDGDYTDSHCDFYRWFEGP